MRLLVLWASQLEMYIIFLKGRVPQLLMGGQRRLRVMCSKGDVQLLQRNPKELHNRQNMDTLLRRENNFKQRVGRK